MGRKGKVSPPVGIALPATLLEWWHDFQPRGIPSIRIGAVLSYSAKAEREGSNKAKLGRARPDHPRASFQYHDSNVQGRGSRGTATWDYRVDPEHEKGLRNYRRGPMATCHGGSHRAEMPIEATSFARIG